MDANPFAVWDDPAPAPASTSLTTASSSNGPKDLKDDKMIEQEARLSLEYQDEDPGWGAGSALASRDNSPEKTRNQATWSRAAPSAVLPISENAISNQASASASTEAQEDSDPGLVQVPAITTEVAEASAATVKDAAAHAGGDQTSTDEPTARADTEQVQDDQDDNTDAFEDSRQEQAVQVQDLSSPEELDEKATIAAVPVEAAEDDDGFDDFGEAAGEDDGAAANDDFGDFDDFETGDAQDEVGFGDDDFGDDGFGQSMGHTEQAAPAPIRTVASTNRDWSALDVTTRSNRIDLASCVAALLPLSAAAERELDSAGLRQVEGPSQVLVSAECRQLWTDLSSLPSVKPIDWVRSKTRRDYLISMGVPVNLDEIHSSFASGSQGSKQLPPLQLHYDSSTGSGSALVDSNGSVPQRSSSLKLSGSSAPALAAQRSASTSNSPRNGNSSPALGSSTNRERMAERRMQELGLGAAPAVDLRRAQELVNKSEDQLTLLSLPALKSMLRELNTMTRSTSSLLTHHLTLRESYQADSEMYNSMIKELVTGAASRFSGSSGSSGGSNSVAGGRGDSRRSTTMGLSASSSGKARVNSLPVGSTAMSGTRSMSPSLRGGVGTSPRR